MQLGARADVRGEGADDVDELARGACEVEEAVVGLDLGRVRRSVLGLRAEVGARIGEDVVEQARCELGGSRVDLARVVVLLDEERPPASAIGPASSSFTVR